MPANIVEPSFIREEFYEEKMALNALRLPTETEVVTQRRSDTPKHRAGDAAGKLEFSVACHRQWALASRIRRKRSAKRSSQGAIQCDLVRRGAMTGRQPNRLQNAPNPNGVRRCARFAAFSRAI